MSIVTTVITSIPPTAELLEARLSSSFTYYLNTLENVPGGLIVLRYIRSSYKNDPIRSVLEFTLFLFAVHYFLSSKRKENKSDIVKFSQREIDELNEEWEPALLVEPVGPLEAWLLKEYHVKGQNGSHVQIVQKPELGVVANLASMEFLDLSSNDRLKAVARECISMVGVGACGPPNFYGTQDVHVRLEEDLARFLGAEQAILYGQDFVTAGSVVNAFLKRGDVAVVDSGILLPLQKALVLTRCDIEWYDHNDMEHLEQILQELDPVLNKRKPLRRRFIFTEGLFSYSGTLVNLPEIVKLKNKYKYRLFVDESLSIGTLGKTGRGVCEHFDIPRSEISITIGSLATSFASSGGFCVGVFPMVHHQRINSNAYVFSASLPSYSSRVASEAIHMITENIDESGKSKLLTFLHEKVEHAYKKLLDACAISKYLEVASDGNGPIIHLQFKSKFRSALELPEYYGNTTLLTTGKPSRKLNPFSEERNLECYILQRIIDGMLESHRVWINRERIVYEQENLPVLNPRLWIHINNGVLISELDDAVAALTRVTDDVCSTLCGSNDLTILRDALISA
ncbi:PLP-dependent transferase [Metschnikowia bicuspidata]|uniref:serine C-palmitoyltransferase n=1 Tax=Metschnikowia bicuspidata TaxID=27322 RepID=A0A4P9ZF84_9ASCO|nr:PLP-dependent transferase [Metschnikowia bicuspidata]